jgi:hypothetical protein
MAERASLWGRDIDEASADLDDGNVSNGPHGPISEPIPVVDDDYDVRRSSPGSSLTFKPAPAPWYRTRRGLVVLIAVTTGAGRTGVHAPISGAAQL